MNNKPKSDNIILSQKEITEKKIDLYNQIAELTLPECTNSCRLPLSCCSPEYCGYAIDYAKERYNIDLPITNHPTLPLMGEKGCTSPAYLRTSCSLHTCSINSIGVKIGDDEFNKKYFFLREQIDLLEFQDYQLQNSKDKEKEVSFNV